MADTQGHPFESNDRMQKKRKTTIDLEMNLHQGLKGVMIRRFLFVLIFRCTCIFIF